MPPTVGTKKKKKGPAPAHQNKFAFQHNPKSKTTAKILSSPNIHVCRRCHDKIEWRKQYRKYKPRTQPGTCNSCSKRNVKAAYHTICEACTRDSDKAKEIIAAAMASTADVTTEEQPEIPTSEDPIPPSTSSVSATENSKLRVCAICVKELALPDPDDDDEDDALADQVGRIKLRELKTMERQLEREAKEARKARRQSAENENDDDDDQNSRKEGTDDFDVDSLGQDIDNNDDDDDDPFLQAVGGADKLLTGKAYQQKLLAEQRQQEHKQT